MATADIPDIKDKISNLEDKVGNRKSKVEELKEKADKASNKLDEADASANLAKEALKKAKRRREKAEKKLDRSESESEAARHDLGMVQFGANMARNLESRAEDVEAPYQDDHGLIAVTNVAEHADEEPSLLNLSLEATSAERDATISAVRADWTGASARADLRDAAVAVSKAADERDAAAKAQKEASAAAKKANKRLAEAEDELGSARNELDNAEDELAAAQERRREAERQRAAEKADRAAADRTAMPGTGQTTSPYGMRTHPITGVRKLHSGTDFSYGDGRAYAARSGTVAVVTYDGAYGNMVTISHGNGIKTRYAHLASPTVSTGQKVSAGDVVGQIGSTGYSTGPHLHFEVLKNGEFVNADNWLGR